MLTGVSEQQENKMSFRDFVIKHIPRKEYYANIVSPKNYTKIVGGRNNTVYEIQYNFPIYGIDSRKFFCFIHRNERSRNRFMALVQSDRGYTYRINLYYEHIGQLKITKRNDIGNDPSRY